MEHTLTQKKPRVVYRALQAPSAPTLHLHPWLVRMGHTAEEGPQIVQSVQEVTGGITVIFSVVPCRFSVQSLTCGFICKSAFHIQCQNA